MSNEANDFLLYDGECPVCSRFVAWTRLQASRPGIRLADARQEPELVAMVRAKGIEINDSFCLSINGELVHGAAAMALIGQLAQPSGLFARLVVGSLASDVGGRFYPVLVRGRKLLLWLLGKGLIR
jgi:predicted DCC family thiol-disulfide oxidoreductase YuxK